MELTILEVNKVPVAEIEGMEVAIGGNLLIKRCINQRFMKTLHSASIKVGSDLDTSIGEHDNVLEQSPDEIPYFAVTYSEQEMLKRSQLFYEAMKLRRSVRCFSNQPVSLKLVQNLIKTAGYL